MAETWVSSLLGAVFVIEFETGKVIDFTVKSKFCKSCKHWAKEDISSQAYLEWKASYAAMCKVNYRRDQWSHREQGFAI